MHLIGTAGHIDHGKSALIQALTGIHPSRLPEEKKRGLTLDLGYAYLKRPDGEMIGFIDVPGHEKLIKNMAAGATGIGIALLVVDSREGPRNQTREHLNILKLLEVKQVMPVLTKITGCDENKLADSEDQLAALVADSGLQSSPVFRVDSLDKTGIAELKKAVIETSHGLQTNRNNLPLYMPIDRSFKLKGIGTVITGTLYQGSLKKDQKVTISGIPHPVRIKSIHNHNIEVSSIGAGHRVGLHPSDIQPEDVGRGQVVLDSANTAVSNRINVKLDLLPDSPIDIKTGRSFLFYAGTSETVCKVYLAGQDPQGNPLKVLPKGGSTLAQIFLDQPVPFFYQQSFLIRSTSPLVTIAGGKVLDCNPDLKRKVEAAEAKAYSHAGDSASALLAYIQLCPEPVVRVENIIRKFLLSMEDCRILVQKEATLITDSDPDKATEFTAIATLAKLEPVKENLIHAMQKSTDALKTSYSYSEAADILNLPAKLLKTFLTQIKEPVKFTRNNNPIELKFTTEDIRLVQASLVLSASESQVKEKILQRLKKEGLQTTFYGNFKKNFATQLNPFNKMLKHLQDTRQIIKINLDYFLLTDNYQRPLILLKNYQGKNFSVGEFGKALGISRKYSIPLLQYMDNLGITKREGPGRNVNEAKLQENLERLL